MHLAVMQAVHTSALRRCALTSAHATFTNSDGHPCHTSQHIDQFKAVWNPCDMASASVTSYNFSTLYLERTSISLSSEWSFMGTNQKTLGVETDIIFPSLSYS